MEAIQNKLHIGLSINFADGYFNRGVEIDLPTLSTKRDKHAALLEMIEPLVKAALETIDANS